MNNEIFPPSSFKPINVILEVLLTKPGTSTSPILIVVSSNKSGFVKDDALLTTEYFFLFRDKKLDVVQKRVQTMIANLASCGLNSRQASDDDLKFLLQNFLNGGTKNEYGTVMSNV